MNFCRNTKQAYSHCKLYLDQVTLAELNRLFTFGFHWLERFIILYTLSTWLKPGSKEVSRALISNPKTGHWRQSFFCTCTMGGGMSSTGREALNQTNEYRRQHHACDLTWNRAAARHANSLAKKIARTEGTLVRWKKRPNILGKLEHSGSKKWGENLAMGTTMDGKRAVDLWYSEVNKYSYGNNFVPGAGHFTALVWRSTTSMGVGTAKRNRDKAEIVVCNYYPPGNYQGCFRENVLPKGAVTLHFPAQGGSPIQGSPNQVVTKLQQPRTIVNI